MNVLLIILFAILIAVSIVISIIALIKPKMCKCPTTHPTTRGTVKSTDVDLNSMIESIVELKPIVESIPVFDFGIATKQDIQITNNFLTSIDVKFNKEFKKAPIVLITPQSSFGEVFTFDVENVTTKGFLIYLYARELINNNNVPSPVKIAWFAISPGENDVKL